MHEVLTKSIVCYDGPWRWVVTDDLAKDQSTGQDRQDGSVVVLVRFLSGCGVRSFGVVVCSRRCSRPSRRPIHE